MVDAYTTMAGAAERARRHEQRSLSQNTLSPKKSPAKSSASSRLKKKTNDQSTEPIAETIGEFAKSAYQLLKEFGEPGNTIAPSIKPIPSNSKLHTSRPPSPIRPPHFISKSPVKIKADQEPENVSKYAFMVDVIVDANL